LFGIEERLAMPGENSRHEEDTDRAWRSPTLFREKIARRNTVLGVNNLSETDTRGFEGR